MKTLGNDRLGGVAVVSGTGLDPGNADHARIMLITIAGDGSTWFTLYSKGTPVDSGKFNWNTAPNVWPVPAPPPIPASNQSGRQVPPPLAGGGRRGAYSWKQTLFLPASLASYRASSAFAIMSKRSRTPGLG